MLPRHLWKNKSEKPKHVDTVDKIIHPLIFPITNLLSNTDNNQRPQVDFFATDLSKQSRV